VISTAAWKNPMALSVTTGPTISLTFEIDDNGGIDPTPEKWAEFVT